MHIRALSTRLTCRQRSDQLSGETRTSEQTPTPTKETLNATSNYFSQWKCTSIIDTDKSPGADSAKIPRRRIGLAPWRRKNSHDTAWSATSSIKALVMGKTPMVSPRPPSDLGGKEPTTYFQGMWAFRYWQRDMLDDGSRQKRMAGLI